MSMGKGGKGTPWKGNKEFVSPIQYAHRPFLQEDAIETIETINSHETEMCAGEIDSGYINKLLANQRSGYWFLRDKGDKVFGFAITEDMRDHMMLHVICAMQRKTGSRGHGMRLFANILNYSINTMGIPVVLQSTSAENAFRYFKMADVNGYSIFLGPDEEEVGWDEVCRGAGLSKKRDNIQKGIITTQEKHKILNYFEQFVNTIGEELIPMKFEKMSKSAQTPRGSTSGKKSRSRASAKGGKTGASTQRQKKNEVSKKIDFSNVRGA